jgi:hypothetical protein
MNERPRKHVQHLVVPSENGYGAICPACISIGKKFSKCERLLEIRKTLYQMIVLFRKH